MVGKLEGTLRIGGFTGSSRGIHVTLVDTGSRCQVVDITLSYEEFGKVMANQPGECAFEFNDSGAVGMKAENKTEYVPFSGDLYGNGSKARIAKALKPFEVDGWRAREGDIGNSHLATKKGYNVVFFRHVNPETGKPIQRRSNGH